MCSSGLVRVLVATAVLFFAGALSAQRYYGRDHHVYHPPAQAKHQTSSQSSNSRAHATNTTAANNTGHSASATALEHVPAANSKPDAMTPPNGSAHQPQ
jgi:hypothetical protein